MFFNNCIEKNQNKTHFEEGTSKSLYYLTIIPLRIYATISVIKKLQYNFPKMGGVKGRLEFFLKFMRFGSGILPEDSFDWAWNLKRPMLIQKPNKCKQC